MHFMKSDMGGAAAVLGAVEVAAKLNIPLRVIGLIPSTDNSVDGLAVKPNEVISSYSGKTIEIIDTDAEGRLILADGLSYAVCNFQPDVLIDLATLTGSTIRTLGYSAGGLFCNNDRLADALLRIGDSIGERLWRFPMWDDYKDGIKSDIADVKNFSGKPTAGAIYAAKFLEVFDGHPSWAHLDIAGVAVTDSEFGIQNGHGLRSEAPARVFRRPDRTKINGLSTAPAHPCSEKIKMSAMEKDLSFLCISCFFKGQIFLRELKAAGNTVYLVTKKALENADWPREALDEIFFLDTDANTPENLNNLSLGWPI